MIKSAGIIAYRFNDRILEVLLVHPGGPFWAKKDAASWSIPKGIIEDGESEETGARREFQEETSFSVDNAKLELLGKAKSGSKEITAFMCEKDFCLTGFKSNTFEMEWPPKSGSMQTYPENDKAAWYPVSEAKEKIFKAQVIFIEQLMERLNYSEPEDETTEQLSIFDL